VTVAEGGCYCGSVRYSISGEPLSSGICHCRSCRKIAAAPRLPFITFMLDQFRFTKGAPIDFHSSSPVTRSFCGRCGTPLTYRHADYPDRLDIMSCSLDDPERFPPTHHLWVSHRIDWDRIADDLAIHETFPK